MKRKVKKLGSGYDKMPKAVHRDNKNTHNRKGGDGNIYSIRVPSLKRSKSTWRNFYNLYPSIKGYKIFRGSKLKPWKEVK